LSHEDEPDAVSRRHVLQTAAAIIPLHVGSRIAAALAPLGMAGATQQNMAARMTKMNLDAERNVVQTLLQPQSSANLGAGVGGNLDVSA